MILLHQYFKLVVMKLRYTFFSLCLILSLGNQVFSQNLKNNFWKFSELKSHTLSENSLLGKLPTEYQMADLNFKEFSSKVTNATQLKTRDGKNQSITIALPTPEGVFAEYIIEENSVISPKVKDQYTIKTFQGFSKLSPKVQIRCDYSEVGFHAYVYNGTSSFAIEPFLKTDNTTHIVYYKQKISNTPIKCGVQAEHKRPPGEKSTIEQRAPTDLRTFELAFVSSGEYSVQYGGSPYSKTNVLNSLASAVNLINPIYHTDLGIEFTLVSTTGLVFDDPMTDPFDPFGDQSVLIGENQTQIDAILGNGNYDIGHLLVWANTGGLASLGVVCWNPYKGEGFSGNDNSFVTLIVDYCCHELGHQFQAEHNFVSQECGTSSNNFRYEPGEGSSIMSYAGVCGAAASYQSYSNQFFHSASINSMNNYITTYGGCETHTSPGSGNSGNPIADAKANITIPKETPFILVGSATDGNDPSNQLTYMWEQYDGSGNDVTGSPDCMTTDGPLFRFRDPVVDNFKIFPVMSEILSGNNNGVKWDKLPCIARTLHFNLVCRDNNANWGRIGQDAMTATVANTGPFNVTSPNGAENWPGNSTKAVTWNVNGTDAHSTNVDILLSTDGGATFSVLASAVTNNGTYNITVPNTPSTTARILIQGSTGGNFKSASTFFDVSNANFTISSPLPIELLSFGAKKISNEAIQVLWSTASEVNNDHFDVEKSINATEFSTMNTVKGAGNSLEITNYDIMDKHPVKGNNYYRLKQVDIDGSYKYSQIAVVTIDSKGNQLVLYPNPAKNSISLSGIELSEIQEIQIYNQLGQLVKTVNTSFNTINTSSLNQGIYNMVIKTQKEEIVTKFSIN